MQEKDDIDCWKQFDTPDSMKLQVLVRSGTEFKIHPDQQKQWTQVGGTYAQEPLARTKHVVVPDFFSIIHMLFVTTWTNKGQVRSVQRYPLYSSLSLLQHSSKSCQLDSIYSENNSSKRLPKISSVHDS